MTKVPRSMLVGLASLAIAAGAFFGTQEAEAASVNSVISGLVHDAQQATGREEVKISFEDVTWSLDPTGTGDAENLNAAGIPIQALFRIDNVGWSFQEFLDPAGSLDGDQVPTSNFGIFGTLNAMTAAAWSPGDTQIDLTDVFVEVRTIDSSPAPTLVNDGAGAFETAGDFAVSFGIVEPDDHYMLTVGDVTGGTDKITGFRLGLSVLQQSSLPPIVRGERSDGLTHDIFGTGSIDYNLSGEPTTDPTGMWVQGKGDFSVMMIPTPGAALPGLAMLGLLALGRWTRRGLEAA